MRLSHSVVTVLRCKRTDFKVSQSQGCDREKAIYTSLICCAPPGYAFLLFQEETSVQALIDACIEEDGKLYLCVSSPTIKDKPVRGSCTT